MICSQLKPHSTRLFPKHQGANAYQITGIAAQCDWVLLSDQKVPYTYLHQNRSTNSPETVFLSLRSPFHALRHFVDAVLPLIKSSFILISGSEDITIPNQLDRRWRTFSDEERQIITEIQASPYLRHWYIENLDHNNCWQRLSPFPLGMVFPFGSPEYIDIPAVPLVASRPLNMLCSHRHREGPQWQLRKDVTLMAKSNQWSKFCTVVDQELSEADFIREIEGHSFVLCVEGGGLDPSPKAWLALLHGAIPIIRKTAASIAYLQLPVVIINDWSLESFSCAILKKWRDQLAPWYDKPEMREEILYKLSLDYWWSIIRNGIPIDSCPTIAVNE